ncbi:MAG: hypothetical protein WAV73_02250 [Candidatus Moraniibacteriota bacterium]
MENEAVVKDQIQSVPVSEVIAPEAKKKTAPWVWAIGGCLLIVLLFMIVMGALGWWGYKAAKKELREQTPAMEEFKQRMEKATRETDRPDKRTNELPRPVPEDMTLPELE